MIGLMHRKQTDPDRSSAVSVLHALGPDSVGQTVTIGLHRAGETKQVSLTIAERPTA